MSCELATASHALRMEHVSASWRHNGVRVLPSTDPRYTIGPGKLIIRALRSEDSGKYECILFYWRLAPDGRRHMLVRADGTIALHVRQAPTTTQAIVAFHVQPNPAMIGERVTITCVTQADLHQYFLVNGNWAYSDDQMRYSHDKRAGVLYLLNATGANNGTNITCHASSPWHAVVVESIVLRVTQQSPTNRSK